MNKAGVGKNLQIIFFRKLIQRYEKKTLKIKEQEFFSNINNFILGNNAYKSIRLLSFFTLCLMKKAKKNLDCSNFLSLRA